MTLRTGHNGRQGPGQQLQQIPMLRISPDVQTRLANRRKGEASALLAALCRSSYQGP
jgi:hypothetical protein